MGEQWHGKMITVLADNLPMNGGWPNDAEVAITRDDGTLFFMTKDWRFSVFHILRGSSVKIHGSSCGRVSKFEYDEYVSKANNIKLSQ